MPALVARPSRPFATRLRRVPAHRYHARVTHRIEVDPHRVADQTADEAAGGNDDPIFERDLALVRAWATGDHHAGVALLDHYRNLVRRACGRFGVRSEDAVADLWQDLVVRVLGHLPTLETRLQRSFAGYLVFHVRDLAGRRRAAAPAEADEPAHDPRGARDAWDGIQHCWGRLRGREHRVFELRYLQGKALGEIAELLGSNANAVAQVVFRLARKMRECLEGQGFLAP